MSQCIILYFEIIYRYNAFVNNLTDLKHILCIIIFKWKNIYEIFLKTIKYNYFGCLASNGVVPINDIRGVESMSYIKGEKIVRCKLSAVFRLMDLYGWTQGINNQVSVIIIFILII